MIFARMAEQVDALDFAGRYKYKNLLNLLIVILMKDWALR